MIPTAIAVLSLGLVVLGYLLKKQTAENGKLKQRIQTLETVSDTQKKQLEISARPVDDPSSIIDRLRSGGL